MDDLERLEGLIALAKDKGLVATRYRVGSIELVCEPPRPELPKPVVDPHAEDKEKAEEEQIIYGASEGGYGPYDPDEFAALQGALS